MEPSRFIRALERSGVEFAPRTATMTLGSPAARTMRRGLTAVLAVLLLVVPGCKANTCIGGQNMTNPRVLGEFATASSAPTLRIGWDAGTELGALLPDGYFEDVVVGVGWGGDGALIENVSYTGERELTVVFSSLEELLAERDAVSFTLEFPDRAEFTDCSHGGTSDSYLLDVTLHFDDLGSLESTDFAQRVHYGFY